MRSKDLHVAIVLALMCSCGSGQLTFTHHNWTEVEIYLKDVQTRYSNIARLYSIGRSVEGESSRAYIAIDNRSEYVMTVITSSHHLQPGMQIADNRDICSIVSPWKFLLKT